MNLIIIKTFVINCPFSHRPEKREHFLLNNKAKLYYREIRPMRGPPVLLTFKNMKTSWSLEHYTFLSENTN